jgi:squalene-hopene/tetraprenyl-beta-curcumene cyclase
VKKPFVTALRFFIVASLAFAALPSTDAALAPVKPLKESDVSFQNEVQRAVEKGIDFLRTTQNSNGWWSTPDHPSVTALALSAFAGHAQNRYKDTPEVKKGYAFVLGCAKPDGSIYVTNLVNYNTAISMMGLLAARDPNYDSVIKKARGYLVGSQVDMGEKGKVDTQFDGGVGYGSKYAHSDMNNTLTALEEALYYSKSLVADKDMSEAKDLNWAAAIHFIESCQQLPGNKQEWVSRDPKDRGGFVYYPGNSMAGGTTNASGKVALRSYGSISYAGLLSYIYATSMRM